MKINKFKARCRRTEMSVCPRLQAPYTLCQNQQSSGMLKRRDNALHELCTILTLPMGKALTEIVSVYTNFQSSGDYSEMALLRPPLHIESK